MQAELEALGKALEAPQRPVIAIVGGAKVSTKLDLLENLITKVQALVIGGAMANTFLHRAGRQRAEVARREGHGRHRAAHPRQGRGRGLRDHPAGRRDRGVSFPGQRALARLRPRRASGRRHGARRRPAVDRAHQGRDRRRRDAGVERPARRLRDDAVRPGHRDGRALRGRAHQGRTSSSRSRAAATRSRRSTTRMSPTSSPTCRPPAARSSNGWRAASSPASRRCGSSPDAQLQHLTPAASSARPRSAPW